MGIPTPTYYDQLLLTKCKLLLQAALANPKRRGGTFSYEEFVVGLDERDEGTIRTFEILLQETAVRRPRKVTSSTAANSSNRASGSGSASTIDPSTGQRRRRTIIPPATGSRLRRLSVSLDDSSDNTDSSSEDDREPEREGYEVAGSTRAEALGRIIQNLTGGADAGDGTRQSRPRAVQNAWMRDFEPMSLGRIEARHAPAARAGDATTTRPVGIPIDRTVTTTTTTSTGGAGGALTPSERLREHERGALFGFEAPVPSFSELLNNIAHFDLPPRSHSSPDPNAVVISSSSELPTFQELWNVVTDRDEERYPSESINSFDSFLHCLNSTSAVSSSNPLSAIDMNGLLAELTLRDVTIPIRVRNAVARRRTSASPLLEGIWRIQAGPAEPYVDDGSEPVPTIIAGNTFSDFARRRRALTREREEQGALTGGGGVVAGESGSIGMVAEASTASSSNLETPHSSTSPATSEAPSPAATCPAAAVTTASASTSGRPLTSADRAIAAMRQRREIAPLRPSNNSRNSAPSNPAQSRENLSGSNEDPSRDSQAEAWIRRELEFQMGLRGDRDAASAQAHARMMSAGTDSEQRQ
ncbi:hypothetical protein JCM3766R1_000454 [Sporobolomyces carnicolor]